MTGEDFFEQERVKIKDPLDPLLLQNPESRKLCACLVRCSFVVVVVT